MHKVLPSILLDAEQRRSFLHRSSKSLSKSPDGVSAIVGYAETQFRDILVTYKKSTVEPQSIFFQFQGMLARMIST